MNQIHTGDEVFVAYKTLVNNNIARAEFKVEKLIALAVGPKWVATVPNHYGYPPGVHMFPAMNVFKTEEEAEVRLAAIRREHEDLLRYCNR